MDDMTRIQATLHLSKEQVEKMIDVSVAEGKTLESVITSIRDTVMMIEKVAEAKLLEEEMMKVQQEKIRQEENAILEKHRDLIERRVIKIALACHACGSACTDTYGYSGSSRSRFTFLTCGNVRCVYHTPEGQHHYDTGDFPVGICKEQCKRKMFYDPNK